MGIREDTNMTILVDEQQDSSEVNIGGQGWFSGGFVPKLLRQNSLLSRQNSLLPDFNSLPDFDSLSPDITKYTFDFDEDFYQTSSMEDSLKGVSAYEIENTIPPQCIKQEAMSPGAAQSGDPDFASVLSAITSANTTTTTISPAGSLASLVGVKQESLDSESEAVTFHRDGGYELYSSKVTCEEDTACLWDLQTRIQRASRDLHLPKNPWLWSKDDVNRWLYWVLPTYGMQPTFYLELDGPRLCHASVKTLEKIRHLSNLSQAAEIIKIEMDLWKQCFNIETSQKQMTRPQVLQQPLPIPPSISPPSLSPPPMPFKHPGSEAHKVYCDLDVESRPATSQHNACSSISFKYPGSETHKVYADLSESRPATSQHNACSSISVIPTPVSTAEATSLLGHEWNTPQVLPRMMCDLTLDEIQQQMAYEQQQRSRSTLPSLHHVPPMSHPMSSSFPVHGWDTTSQTLGWDSTSSSESGSSAHSSDYSTEEESRECSPAPPSAMPRGLPHSRNSIKLWQFLRSLLDQPCSHTCIRWIDREKGIFKIEDSQRVAKLWGQRKNRPAMNYDKLSRSIRQYYKKKIIKKTDNSKRLVYQFCAPYL